jgi:DNA-binding SARP family transcriptional activator/predicted ATPase
LNSRKQAPQTTRGRQNVTVEIRILGPLEVVDGQGSLAPLGGRKQRIVLAALVLRAGETVSADRLVDLVWDESPPARPEATLQVYLSNLRRLFTDPAGSAGGARVLRQAPGYRLELGSSVLDRHRFDALVLEGRQALQRGDHADALDRFETANGLWRGPLAADLADERFVQAAALEADERRRETLALTYETLFALSRHAEAVASLEGLCAEDPAQERMWELLMLALYRSGRPADALSAFHRAREALANLGLDPSPALGALQARILGHDPTLTQKPAPSGTASLLGRDFLVDRVVDLLVSEAGETVVSLVGPAGVGKSRVAAAAAARGPHRTVTVSLHDLAGTEPDSLASLAAALDVAWRDDPRVKVREALATSPTLVVLDECEHRPDAARDLIELIRGVPGTRVLATSRTPLGLEVEVVVAVDPLGPDGDSDPAVELFLSRARRVGSAGTPMDLEAVAEVCRLVDRLPLGVELAAAQLRTMSLPELVERLSAHVNSLADPARPGPHRHRSLGAAFEGTIETLDPRARALLHGLTVFRGGWNLDAVRAVFGAGALDALDALVVAGVVWVDSSGGQHRYRLPAAVRDVLAEQGPPAEDVVRRHAAHYASEARRWGEQRSGYEGRKAVEARRLDQHNVANALDSALDRDGDLAAAVALAIGDQFFAPSRLGWFAPRLAALVARDAGTGEDRHRIRAMHGYVCYLRGDLAVAKELLSSTLDELAPADEWALRARTALATASADEGDPAAVGMVALAVTAAGTLGRPDVLTRTLDAAAVVAVLVGDLDQAEEWTLDKLEIERSRRDDTGRCFSVERLAWIAYQRGADAEAERLAREALDAARELGVELVEVYATSMLGHALLERDPQTSLGWLVDASVRLLEEDVPLDAADVLVAVAAACGLLGDHAAAVRFAAAADRRYADASVARPPHTGRVAQHVDASSRRLPDAERRRAERAGQVLTSEDLAAALISLRSSSHWSSSGRRRS